VKWRQGPSREQYTDQCSATRVWRSSRAWPPHFRRVPPASADLRQQIQPASGTGRELVCQKVRAMLRVVGWEKIQIALHRVRNLLRMHGGKNEMSGFRSLEGRQRRLVIPDLTNEDDIRRLAKRAPQPGRKRAGVTSDLSLGEMTAIAGELILDGVFDRHYMPHQQSLSFHPAT